LFHAIFVQNWHVLECTQHFENESDHIVGSKIQDKHEHHRTLHRQSGLKTYLLLKNYYYYCIKYMRFLNIDLYSEIYYI